MRYCRAVANRSIRLKAARPFVSKRREARRADEIKTERKRAVVNWGILALLRQWR